jgi:hypothetical protein
MQLHCWAIEILCVFAPKDDVVDIDNSNHFGSNKETGIEFGLFQSTGHELFRDVLPKMLEDSVKVHKGFSSVWGLFLSHP